MNRLSKETSPYLLQHAHNPVDWYPWGEEAFEKAERENKPILVSIGYSTCHWCHVMERESFESEATAAYMNEHFINIKVDREERPDVDQIYMDAVQALTRSGGWPLNCFLTPDKKPFFGGTYYPPEQAHNRPSWVQVLRYITQIFNEQRDEVNAQANKLMEYIQRSDAHFVGEIEGLSVENRFTTDLLDNIYYKVRDNFDRVEGGFGNAPKFPGSMTIQYLLNYHHFTGNAEVLIHAQLSLDKMIMGGIYDQIGGGFARYATDREWLIPHFEKMLYDNALLVCTLSNAYKITKSELYKETIEETLEFVKREMTNAEGGFYSAQDADSEGVEGKYYVWSKAEIDEILGKDAILFNEFYGVSEGGNWEHTNILWREITFEAFVEKHHLDLADFKNKMRECRQKLFEVRDKRIKPSLDDKVLLDWNALMATAYAKAYSALGNLEYKEAAERNISFLLKAFAKLLPITIGIREFKGKSLGFYHTYKDGQAQYDAFLTDYAYLIDALIEIYFINSDTKCLTLAGELVEYVIEQFYDADEHLFYFTNANQSDIIVRKKELYDNATPSGNSTMVHNLQRLGTLLGKENYREIAQKMLLTLSETIEKYGGSFSRWSNAMVNEVHGIHEIAILGTEANDYANIINSWFVPNKVIMATQENRTDFPLLADKIVLDNTMVYVCQDYTCKIPTSELDKVSDTLNPDSYRD